MGPTGVGKTVLSLAVGEVLGAEVISMDSRQVYRGMDVGTGKVGLRDRARLPHHGLDLRDPDEAFSAGEFARYARRRLAEIHSRGRVPLLVGGTGFFLRALTDPMFREPALDPERRRALRRYLEGLPVESLRRWVRALDPERAPVAESGGPHRMIRTLEVALLTGWPLSWWHRNAPPAAPPMRGPVVLLEREREELYRLIDRRAERMFREGFVEEVERLLEAGYGPEDPGFTGAGYREVVRLLQGETSLEEAVEETRRAHRRYARRQLTWFRGQLPPGTVRISAAVPMETQVRRVVEVWKEWDGLAGAGRP